MRVVADLIAAGRGQAHLGRRESEWTGQCCCQFTRNNTIGECEDDAKGTREMLDRLFYQPKKYLGRYLGSDHLMLLVAA